MEGYSETGAIYFSRGQSTSFARLPKVIDGNRDLESQFITGSYDGAPPYKKIDGKLPVILREYHSAEHQVFNAFQKKISKKDTNASIKELAEEIPDLEEIKDSNDYSNLCGTTIFLSSGLILILTSLPNFFKFYNTNLFFMSFWIATSFLITYLVSKYVQKKFFLSEAKDYQLLLARTALKEALNNE